MNEPPHTKERARGTGALGIPDGDRFEPNPTLSAICTTRLRPLGRGAATLTKRPRTLGRKVRRDTTSRYGPGALAAMEAALREDRGMAEDAVT